jgi:hypothetical protein
MFCQKFILFTFSIGKLNKNCILNNQCFDLFYLSDKNEGIFVMVAAQAAQEQISFSTISMEQAKNDPLYRKEL